MNSEFLLVFNIRQFHSHVISLHFVQLPFYLYPQYSRALGYYFARFNYCTKMGQIRPAQGEEEFFLWQIVFLLRLAKQVPTPQSELVPKPCVTRGLEVLQTRRSTESPSYFL